MRRTSNGQDKSKQELMRTRPLDVALYVAAATKKEHAQLSSLAS